MKMMLVILAALAATLTLQAETETVDGYTWTYQVNEDGTVTIGAYSRDFSSKTNCCVSSARTAISPDTTGAITIPSALGNKRVTHIGVRAFWNCRRLTNVTIPDGVTSVGDEAFKDCSNLTRVTISDSVTSIGRAFEGCNGLTSVTIPGSVTNMASGAFMGCNRMKSFVVAHDNPKYKSMAGLLLSKDGKSLLRVPGGLTDVTIPDGVTSIEDEACARPMPGQVQQAPQGFRSETPQEAEEAPPDRRGGGLVSVVIPDSVTSIGARAFSGCSELKTLNIPDGVIDIGWDAFEGCRGLADANGLVIVGHVLWACLKHDYGSESRGVGIPDGVTRIREGVFAGCHWLTDVTIPGSVTNIERGAFVGCNRLKRYVVSRDNPMYKSEEGLLLSKDGKTLVHVPGGLTRVRVPDGVTYIGEDAFGNLPWASEGECMLTDVTLPDGVTHIGDGAFHYCSGLTNVTLPSSMTSIGNSAFAGCSGLTSVTIPDGVTRIGNRAFIGCEGLKSVTIPDSVTDIGSAAFNGCRGLADADGFVIVRHVLYDYCGEASNVKIPKGVTHIGAGMFENRHGLKNVVIPDSVTSIGEAAFFRCEGLTSVTIPDTVTNIGFAAFKGCRGLADAEGFVIVRGVLYDYCGDSSNVKIPNNVASVSDGAFKDLSKVLKRENSRGLADANGFVIVRNVLHDYLGSDPNVTIPDGVTRIGAFAFANRDLRRQSVTIPDSVTSIGKWAFMRCGLKMVTIPSSVTSIDEEAFDPNTKIIREKKVRHEAGGQREKRGDRQTDEGGHESKRESGFAAGFLWGLGSALLFVALGGGAWWAFRRAREAGES